MGLDRPSIYKVYTVVDILYVYVNSNGDLPDILMRPLHCSWEVPISLSNVEG